MTRLLARLAAALLPFDLPTDDQAYADQVTDMWAVLYQETA